MPVINSIDSRGKSFFKYGPSGKKYYYNPKSKISIGLAKAKAIKQGRAISYNKFKLKHN